MYEILLWFVWQIDFLSPHHKISYIFRLGFIGRGPGNVRSRALAVTSRVNEVYLVFGTYSGCTSTFVTIYVTRVTNIPRKLMPTANVQHLGFKKYYTVNGQHLVWWCHFAELFTCGLILVHYVVTAITALNDTHHCHNTTANVQNSWRYHLVIV